MIVFIVNGYPRSGKDTFYKILNGAYNVMLYSTVDTPKRILKIMGWSGEKTPEFRKALSDLKDMYTNLFNGPFIEAIGMITTNEECDAIVVMCREPGEIDKLKKWCDKYDVSCYTVFINRTTTEKLTNHADKNVEEYKYDIYIDNTGTLDTFKNNVLELASTLIKD